MSKRLSGLYAWRYRCPGCGSVALEKLTGKRSIRNKQYRMCYDAWQKHKDTAKRYYCANCGDRYEKVRDAKTGGLAQPD